MKTLPTLTCLLCYRKYGGVELQDVGWDWWTAIPIKKPGDSPFKCPRCLPAGQNIRGCADCLSHLRRVEGLTPVEEKLIALNSCYGFITRYSISDGHRQGITYPRHVKGHITLFPNNVQELARPSNPPPQNLHERRLTDHPRLKMRTPHIVPPTARGIDDHDPIDIQEIVGALLEEQNAPGVATGYDCVNRDDGCGADDKGERLYETGSSGIFDLDGWPDITDVAKLRHLLESMGEAAVEDQGRRNACRASAKVWYNRVAEPSLAISRGEDFANHFDTWYLARTFPSLLPRGMGGPRQVEEWVVAEREAALQICEAEFAARRLVSSRNITQEAVEQALGVTCNQGYFKITAEMLVQRHGGGFASHLVFLFLVFNIRVRSRNRRELTAARLEKASIELESSGKTADPAVNQLLRSLSLYGYRQPIIPAIWYMLNPNDITNPIKLKLTACRTRETEEAEKFLGLDQAYKRARLAISDSVSLAIFFHRKVSMCFEHYVNVGEESVFVLVSQYNVAVETNESIFSEDLDEGASAVMRAETSVTAGISRLIGNTRQFAASFDEANFCAGAVQVHTHSQTCVKYVIGRQQNEILTGLAHLGKW
uniref:Uncharacterized protein n=1 Tax=Fusarium oxysporum (strain Fo5176) TaxID=660025 RepID=A0A0D2YD84_FUSOF